MKKILFLSLFAMALGLTGCSKDAEINAFITEFDGVTKDIVSKIDANPTAAGIDEAQKAFDAKKAALTDKWAAIKDAVGMQVSAETKAKLEESLKNNMKALTDVAMRNGMKMAMDKEAMPKFQKLMSDYGSTFKM